MFRLSGLLSIVVAALCGTLLFWISQSVQRAEKNLAKTSHYVLSEEESLRVLSAEWDYLNRPERLEELTRSNLDMDAVHAEEKNFINNVGQIPEPIVPVAPKMKPKNFIQNVSTQHEGSKRSKSSTVIKKTENQNFDKLLDNLETDRGL